MMKGQENPITIPKNNNQNVSTETSLSKDEETNVGQGKLYSPNYAIKLNSQNKNKGITASRSPSEKGEESMGVVEEIRRHLGGIKERVLEKLAAASVPADALENARNYLEVFVKDVTVAAHGLTKDALNRIKTHLVDILPSLSPSLTRKMVDDAAEEANGEEEKKKEENGRSSKGPYASPASSFFASLRPFSRL